MFVNQRLAKFSIFLFVILFSSCLSVEDQEKIKEQKTITELATALNEAKNSLRSVDSICDGMSYGMTSDEVLTHVEHSCSFSLQENHNNVKYERVIKPELKVIGDVEFGYFENELTALRIMFTAADELQAPALMIDIFRSIWMEYPTYKSFLLKNNYYLIKDNSVIFFELSNKNKIIMMYANAIMQNKIGNAII